MEILNNREISITVWLAVFAVWALSKKGIRSSFKTVVDAFSERAILIPFSLLVLHTLASIWLLKNIGLWESHQVKNAILWFISVAAVSFFRLPKIADDRNYFKKAITDNLKIIVLFEFVVTFYTFNLFLELLFVPFMALLGGLLAVSKMDDKYSQVEKILNKIVELIGVAIIVYTGYKLLADFDEFAQRQTFYDFTMPIALSVLLLPFIYALHVFLVYERIFMRMKFSIKDEKLGKYAKTTAIVKYHLNISALSRWADALSREDIGNKFDIDELHKEIDRLRAEEKNPPVVSFENGWSPYSVATILEKKGLKTGYYKKLYDNEWFASSPYLDIGDGILPNNIAYYIEGNKEAVTRLKIKMNINELEQAKEAHEELYEIASILHLNALRAQIDEKFENAIVNGINEENSVNSKIVKVVTEHWNNNKTYEVTFTIENI